MDVCKIGLKGTRQPLVSFGYELVKLQMPPASLHSLLCIYLAHPRKFELAYHTHVIESDLSYFSSSSNVPGLLLSREIFILMYSNPN